MATRFMDWIKLMVWSGAVCDRFALASLLIAVSLFTHQAYAMTALEGSVVTDSERPNILLIVLDDLGYTDLGLWGGVIGTPNIDALAQQGRILTNFHTAPTCSPTRSMLMSGVDNHLAGLGSMAETLADNQRGKPGYEGYLNFRVAALPELLSDAGYRTYMTGKWHLGLTEETSPAARGFEKSFALLEGGAGHFSNMLRGVGHPGKAGYRENGQKLDSLPEDFYSTAFYTDRMIEYLEEGRSDKRPFFAYLAYTAVHHPIQAPEESIARFEGAFDAGYDEYALDRLNALKELGFVDQDVQQQPPFPEQPPWHQLSEEGKQYSARKMEAYAAMVYDVDRYVGKIVNYLKASGVYDNTVIFLMSDNGPEGHEMDSWPDPARWISECCDNSLENIGTPDSYIWIGEQWMRGADTPLRMYKGYTSQGGIMAPALIHAPFLFSGGKRYDELIHVMDVMPTLLELAEVDHPGAGPYRDRTVFGMQGRSFLNGLLSPIPEKKAAPRPLGWELFGKRAVRLGPWKAVYRPSTPRIPTLPGGIKADTWQLYNLEEDPGELVDLAESHAEKLEMLIGYWREYVKENNVVLPDTWRGY